MKRFLISLAAGLLILLLIAMVAWLYLWPRDERTTAALNTSSGQIAAGQRFQVSIGDSWEKADKKIRRQFNPSYTMWEKPSPPPAYSQTVDGPVLLGDATVTYRDQSWRNGTITLKLLNGRVVQISWSYSPLYIDT